MRTKIMLALINVIMVNVFQAQSYPSLSISEQVKTERDIQLKELNDRLSQNEQQLKILTEKIASSNSKKLQDEHQLVLETKIKLLEEAPKLKVKLNGRVALIELLNVQRDFEPTELLLTSQAFFSKLGNTGNIQQYKSFNSWKAEYETWYKQKGKDDQIVQVINNSINLINDASNKIPLYGSIIQTVSSGVSFIAMSIGKKNEALLNKTPSMLNTINAVGQFETQKSVIDLEWEIINKELKKLQIENDSLLYDQLKYYEIPVIAYKTLYKNTTIDTNRDKFKDQCTIAISKKISTLDQIPETKDTWIGQIETFMYKVQSLRLRFGQLMIRMYSNMNRYSDLIEIYGQTDRFPSEFTTVINELNKPLQNLKKILNDSNKAEKYIEESATLYISK